MYLKKIIMTGLLLATTSLALITTSASAEGFFSTLFGENSNETSFKNMLKHVPADTSYMFAISKPIPDDVMKFHIDRGQKAFEMFSKLGKREKVENASSDAFFKAITNELSEKLESGKIEETGLSLKALSVIYGYKLMPVMRMTITDKDKIMELIRRAEDESDHKVTFDKCGEFECIQTANHKKGEPSIVIALLKNEVVMSVSSSDKKKEMINHLIGKADPEVSYSKEKWANFLKHNDYKGFGDGFVNLKKLYDENKTLITAGLFAAKKYKKKESPMTEDEIKACAGVVEDHINNMPEIAFGTKNLQEKKLDYEMVFKTSTGVSETLQSLANATNIAKRSANPIFDMGVNLDFKKTSAALTDYSSFLIASAEKNKCDLVKARDVRKSMGGMMLVMNTGLSQLKSLYFAINDLEMDQRMQPEKIEAILSIGSDNPEGLLAMVGMFVPPLAQLKIPENGSTVKIPTGVIPSRGMPVPPLYVSRSDTAINIMIGNDKPEMLEYKGDVPELMSFAIDGKRYYEIITKVLNAIPVREEEGQTDKADKEREEMTEMMETMGTMTGKIRQEISADKRGLVVNYHMQY
ncbi:MAG: hypothetical protein V3U64_04750 [Cocleimonas sp.]